MGHEASCAMSHREGRSAEVVSDGTGAYFDLVYRFFCKLTGEKLQAGAFASVISFCQMMWIKMRGRSFDRRGVGTARKARYPTSGC